MLSMVDEAFLTSVELAELLRVKPDTVHKWRQREVGPPYIRAEGRVLYPKEEIQRWLEAQRE